MAFVVEDGTRITGSNSYASVAAADSYNLTHIDGADWSFLDLADKQAALVTASAIFDDGFDWLGRRVSEQQSMEWPRYGVSDRDGFMIRSNVIPKVLVNATCELARILTLRKAAGQSPTGTQQSSSVSQIKVGPIELTMDAAQASSQLAAIPSLIPRTVGMKLRDLGDSRYGYGSGKLVR